MLGQKTTLTGLPNDLAWKKYCGFLDLTLGGFLAVQEQKLLDYLPKLAQSGLGRHFLKGRHLRSLQEFWRIMPLTTYEDVVPFLRSEAAAALPEPPVFWAQTMRRDSQVTRIPYTQTAFDQLLDNAVTFFLLASATGKGEVGLEPGNRVLYNLPPHPYLSGAVGEGLAGRLHLRSIVSQAESQGMDFEDKIRLGFRRSLRSGVDAVVSMTSVLLKIGEQFDHQRVRQSRPRELLHPMAAWRCLRALLISRLQRRPILPRDLWPVKMLICWGTDTALYRQQLKEYWGCEPYEIAATTEAGILALQSWNRQGMTFLPTPNFLEFIPEQEALGTRRGLGGSPDTLLLNELEVGKRYEVVITSLAGMPFLRYRLGHLVKVLALRDEEAGIDLPQVSFDGRIDDVIDIAGFTRIDERALHRAIQGTGVPVVDWAARKELEARRPVLRVYLEPQDGHPPDLAERLHRILAEQDSFYRDLDHMLGVRPIGITLLAKGTFGRYYEKRCKAGIDLARGRVAKINPADEEIQELLHLSNGGTP